MNISHFIKILLASGAVLLTSAAYASLNLQNKTQIIKATDRAQNGPVASFNVESNSVEQALSSKEFQSFTKSLDQLGFIYTVEKDKIFVSPEFKNPISGVVKRSFVSIPLIIVGAVWLQELYLEHAPKETCGKYVNNIFVKDSFLNLTKKYAQLSIVAGGGYEIGCVHVEENVFTFSDLSDLPLSTDDLKNYNLLFKIK